MKTYFQSSIKLAGMIKEQGITKHSRETEGEDRLNICLIF